MSDCLKSLTKEQRDAVRSLIERTYKTYIGCDVVGDPKVIAMNILPEPEPVMVPLEDVKPLLDAIKLIWGEIDTCGHEVDTGYREFMIEAYEQFRAKHGDKL